jgi:hypothetical protein
MTTLIVRSVIDVIDLAVVVQAWGIAKMVRLVASFVVTAAAACATLAAETVLVHGEVREQGTDRPVAGAVVQLSNGQTEVRVESDEHGRYKCRIPPGIITGHVVELPPPLVKPLRAFRAPVELAADVPEQSLPSIEVRRGRSVRGRVVDADGKPAAGAMVQASWQAFERWLESYVDGPKSLTTRSDDQGEFSFTQIDPVDNPNAGDRLRFWAASGEMATETLASPPADKDAPVELRLSPNGMVSLSGRVVDAAGHPISGAKVQVWTQWRTEYGSVLVQMPLAVSLDGDILSDPAGQFRTPRVMSSKGEYSMLVSCDGYLPAGSEWFQPGEASTADVQELRLRRLRTVTGRVVDRQRHPLAGARVYQSGDGVRPTATITGHDGRFALADVAENPAFVFAELDGYRFAGRPVAQSGETEIILSRDDEAVAPLTWQPANVLDRKEELELARQVLRPALEQALRSNNGDERRDVLYYWMGLNPADALERIDNGAIPNLTADDKDFLLAHIARVLVRDDLDEAMSVAGTIVDSDRRARALIDLAGALPTSDLDAKRALLDEALLASTHSDTPSLRALWQACVADCLLDLGETDRARTLLEETGATAATLPLAGDGANIRRRTAEVLARIDVPSALALLDDLAHEKARHLTLGKIAYRVAAQQPAEAERALAMIDDRYRREHSTPRVCYRMATVDGERARNLAQRLTSPYLRALSLGWTARGWSISDPRRARQTLDEAFNILRSLVDADEGRFYSPQCAAVAAAVLLPVVETIDPQLVREYLWRAVSFRRSYPGGNQHDRLAEAATLALLLAQYDREVARLVLGPIVDQLKSLDETSVGARAAVDAACAIDPKWAASLFESENIDDPHYHFSWRHEFAQALAIQPSIRTRVLLGHYLWSVYWLPGGPDNDFQTEF